MDAANAPYPGGRTTPTFSSAGDKYVSDLATYNTINRMSDDTGRPSFTNTDEMRTAI
jgi:hypothetical protein